MVYTEMISADGTIRHQEKTLKMAEFTQAERPVNIQLFGADDQVVADAVKIISEKKPDCIDLNFGCPAKKVVKRGAGVALMRDLDRLQSMARAAVQATHLPITAKLRSGWDFMSINVLEASQRLQDVGVRILAIHPRTQTQQFRGQSDWNLIKQVKETVDIPVWGSGDIRSAHDAGRMLESTGCDAVLVGRAAFGNPWIFRQINDYVRNGIQPVLPGLEERLQVCLRHLDLAIEIFGSHRALYMMRKQIAFYVKNFPNAAALRYNINATTSCEQLRKLLKDECDFVTSAETIEK